MKSHFLSQLSGICSGICIMSGLIENDSTRYSSFCLTGVLSFVLLFWSISERKHESNN